MTDFASEGRDAQAGPHATPSTTFPPSRRRSRRSATRSSRRPPTSTSTSPSYAARNARFCAAWPASISTKRPPRPPYLAVVRSVKAASTIWPGAARARAPGSGAVCTLRRAAGVRSPSASGCRRCSGKRCRSDPRPGGRARMSRAAASSPPTDAAACRAATPTARRAGSRAGVATAAGRSSSARYAASASRPGGGRRAGEAGCRGPDSRAPGGRRARAPTSARRRGAL